MLSVKSVLRWPAASNTFFLSAGAYPAGEALPLQGKPGGTSIPVDLNNQTARRVRIFVHADDDPVNFTITGKVLGGEVVTEVVEFATGNLAKESVNAYESVSSIIPTEPLTASTIGIGTGYSKWVQLNGETLQNLVTLSNTNETTTWSLKYLNTPPYSLNKDGEWVDNSDLASYGTVDFIDQTTSMSDIFSDGSAVTGAARLEISATVDGDSLVWQINEKSMKNPQMLGVSIPIPVPDIVLPFDPAVYIRSQDFYGHDFSNYTWLSVFGPEFVSHGIRGTYELPRLTIDGSGRKVVQLNFTASNINNNNFLYMRDITVEHGTYGGGFTFFFVGKVSIVLAGNYQASLFRISNDANYAIANNYSGNTFRYWAGNSSLISLYDNANPTVDRITGGRSPTLAQVDNINAVVGMRQVPSGFGRWYVNGSLANTSAINYPQINRVFDELRIASNYNSTLNSPLKADFYEFIYFNQMLSDAEINSVGNQLRAKYGF